MKDIEISYIAGFFDGEGSVELKQRIKRGKKHGFLLRVRIGQKSFEILEWIKKKLGVGIIHYNQNKKLINSSYHQFEIRSIKDGLFLLRLIQPYLIVKRDKVNFFINELEKRAKKHRSVYRAVYSI